MPERRLSKPAKRNRTPRFIEASSFVPVAGMKYSSFKKSLERGRRLTLKRVRAFAHLQA